MVSDNTATYESTPELDEEEKNLLFEFNDCYNAWCDDNNSYYEHLKKTFNILLFVQEDICRNKVLYTLCDKKAMVIDDGEKFYIGDLLDHVLRSPLNYFDQEEFTRIGATCNDKKEKQKQIQNLRDCIVTSNDYRYYYIDETDETVEYVNEYTSDSEDEDEDEDNCEEPVHNQQIITVSQLI